MHSQVKRKSFTQTMKDQAISFVKDARKVILGGYSLRVDENTVDYLTMHDIPMHKISPCMKGPGNEHGPH